MRSKIFGLYSEYSSYLYIAAVFTGMVYLFLIPGAKSIFATIGWVYSFYWLSVKLPDIVSVYLAEK